MGLDGNNDSLSESGVKAWTGGFFAKRIFPMTSLHAALIATLSLHFALSKSR
jgi:hypothetical protein